MWNLIVSGVENGVGTQQYRDVVGERGGGGEERTGRGIP